MQELDNLAAELSALNRPADDNEVDHVVAWLGRYPSIESLERVVSFYKACREKLLTDDIPSIMAEAGLTKATTETGLTVGLQTVVNATKGPKAFEWLENNGMGALIKTNLELGKGQFSQAVADALQSAGVDYVKKDEVHPMTLKKAIGDWLEAGNETPPEEAIKVSVFTRAKIS
jgi:hypothetical protein